MSKSGECRRCHNEHAKEPNSAAELACKAALAAHMRAQRARHAGRSSVNPERLPLPPVPGEVVLSMPYRPKPTRADTARYSISIPKGGLAAWLVDPGLLPKRPPGRAA